MNQTLEIRYSIEEAFQDALIAELFELGFSGFVQHSTFLNAFIDESDFNRIDSELYASILETFGGLELEQSRTIHQPKNWNEEWEKTIQPITVGEFYIRPTWDKNPVPGDKIELIIDPKMAFGTGYHETTRLMLHAITKFMKPEHSVLDVGTGTGILGIAAIKKGASSVFGFDIDEWSYANATENMKLNAIEKGFEVALGSFETVPAHTYDMVIANVNRSAILLLKDDIVSHCKKGGFILLSGLLKTEVFIIKESSTFSELTLIEETSEGDWSSLVYQKN